MSLRLAPVHHQRSARASTKFSAVQQSQRYDFTCRFCKLLHGTPRYAASVGRNYQYNRLTLFHPQEADLPWTFASQSYDMIMSGFIAMVCRIIMTFFDSLSHHSDLLVTGKLVYLCGLTKPYEF